MLRVASSIFHQGGRHAVICRYPKPLLWWRSIMLSSSTSSPPLIPQQLQQPLPPPPPPTTTTTTWNESDWETAIDTIQKYWKGNTDIDAPTDSSHGQSQHSQNDNTTRMTEIWTLVDQVVQKQHEQRNDIFLTIQDLNGMVLKWNQDKQQQQESSLSAQDILQKINHYTSLIPSLYIDTNNYNILLNEAKDYELAKEVIQVLLVDGIDNTSRRPTTALYNIAMNALTRMDDNGTFQIHDAAQKGEELLQEMKDLTTKGWEHVLPNNETYSTLIHLWLNSNNNNDLSDADNRAVQRAEELLNESNDFSNVSNCVAVMNAWSKKTDNGTSADRCNQLLQHWKTRATTDEKDDSTNPHDTVLYGIVIAAYAKSGKVKLAQSLMDELLDKYQKTKDPFLIPDQIHFSALIDGWAKSREEGAPQKAEALIEKMFSLSKETKNKNLSPNVISFSTVMNAWAKSKDPAAASRVEAILQRMNTMAKKGYPNVKPNLRTYNTVLDCLANARSKDAAARAEAILDILIGRYHAGEETMKPNTISFTTVIKAYANSRDPDAASKANVIFDRMKLLGVTPEKRTFCSLMSAWGYSRDPRAASIVEDHFRDMKQRYEAGDESCKPDTVAFTSVIHAWSMSKDRWALERAFDILNEMTKLESLGHANCGPNRITYNSVLKINARRKVEDKAVVAWNLLNEMKYRSIQPDDMTFGYLLMACAFSYNFDQSVRERAFQIAAMAIQQAHAVTIVSRYTFCYFFQAAAGFGQDSIVETVHKWCCEAGFERDESIQLALQEVAPHLVRT